MRDPDGNWFERTVDKVVSIASPRQAYIRQHFRRMERDPEYRAGVESVLVASGYRKRGIAEDRVSLAHVGQIGHDQRSADAVALLRLREQRSKSRALRRDNALAAGLINGTAREVVGAGLSPQSNAPEGVRELLEEVWAERADELFPAEVGGFREVQRLLVEKMLEDGEVFVTPAAEGDEAVTFDMVEADRVQWPPGANASDREGSIRDGVERDGRGRIVAYHVAKWHPGDTAIPYSPAPGKSIPATPTDYERIPRGVCRHLALTSRPGQSHGVPWLAPVSDDLARLDLLVKASLERVTMAACLAIFIESAVELDGIMDVTAAEYGYEVDQALKPGLFFKLAPGEKVSTVSPNFPVADVDAFVRVLSRRIGTALGLSFLSVSYDASGYNYSSARVDLIRERRFHRQLQRKLVAEVLNWLWVSVMEDARLRGDVRLARVTDDQIQALSWTLPTQEWVDPRAEGEAIKLKLELGLTTLRDEAARLGHDWEEQAQQRAREKAFVRGLETSGTDGEEALNGAQLDAVKQIVADVSAGVIPADSAKALVQLALPGVTAEIAEALIDPASKFEPKLMEAA